MTLAKASMESLADDIGSDFGMDRPVVDRTGLNRAYDIRLEATSEYRINNNPDPRSSRWLSRKWLSEN